MDIQPENTPQGSKTFVWLIVGAGCTLALCFFLALAGLGLYGVYVYRSMPIPIDTDVIPPVGDYVHSQPNGASLGNPDAPVKVVLYSDFQCPFCKQFWEEAEGKIFQEYVATGKAYFTYRSMGEFLGPESQTSAEAAYCAGDQEKFWEYHDLLFANQGAENSGAFSDARLKRFAEYLNLDQAAFDECLSSGKYAKRVQQDRTDASVMDTNSTPTVFINNEKIVGAQDYETYKDAIEQALAEEGGG